MFISGLSFGIYIEYHDICTLYACIYGTYNCTHAYDFLRGTMRLCNHGPREVKAMVHDHEWFKSTHGLKPPVDTSGLSQV